MTKPKQPNQYTKKKDKRSQYTLEMERNIAIHQRLHELFFQHHINKRRDKDGRD